MTDSFTSPSPVRTAWELETTFGESPADAAAWDTAAESADGFQVRKTSMDFSGLSQEGGADPDLRIRQTEQRAPIAQLRTGDVPFSMKLYGSEAETTGTDTIAETALAKILKHCLGGLSKNNRTTVTALSDQTTYDVADNNAFAAGQVVCVEDTDDLGKLYPVWIADLSTDTITAEKDLSVHGITIANSDVLHPTLTAFIDPGALSRGGSGYTTYSVLSQNNDEIWVVRGGHANISEIVFARGSIPSINGTIMAAGFYEPGNGAPSAPSWTSDPEGGAGLVCGIDTYCHYQDYGTSTENNIHIFSLTVRPNIELARIEGITGLNGVIGYNCGMTLPQIEMEVPFNTDHQDDWDTLSSSGSPQYKTLTFYQLTDHGRGWTVHSAKCCLARAPVPAGFANGEAKRMRLTLDLHEDTANTPTTALHRSPLHISIW